LDSLTYTFYDFYKNKVQFSYLKDAFSKEARHVWVVCKWGDQWLLTRHTDRGIEFPGGKVELGETTVQAAIREVNEETGGIVKKLVYIGQYKVTAKHEIVVKDVYFAEIERIETKINYFETAGPVLLNELPEAIQKDKNFSFIMKDDVLLYSMEWIKKIDKKDQ
jgi:8-oxo-dGTP diphosphatase